MDGRFDNCRQRGGKSREDVPAWAAVVESASAAAKKKVFTFLRVFFGHQKNRSLLDGGPVQGVQFAVDHVRV